MNPADTTTRLNSKGTPFSVHRLGQLLLSALLALPFLLAGCAQQPASNIPENTPPKNLVGWRTAGKLSLSDGTQTELANFSWHHTSQHTDSITLSGHFGLGATMIERRQDKLYLYKEGALLPLDQIELPEAAKTLISTLPLTSLSTWLTGHRATEDSPWQQHVDSWQRFENWRVPRKQTLRHQQWTLKLVSHDWEQLPP